MLLVAIAVFVLAVLLGVLALLRSAIGFARRMRQVAELAASGKALAEQAQELSLRMTRVRAETERLRALMQQFS